MRRTLVGLGVLALALTGLMGAASPAGADTIAVETCPTNWSMLPVQSPTFELPSVAHLPAGSYVSTVYLLDWYSAPNLGGADRFNAPTGPMVNPRGNNWVSAMVCTVSPNELPRGEILITKVEGRGVGLFGYAYDPGSSATVSVMATIDGVRRSIPGTSSPRNPQGVAQAWNADWKWSAAPHWAAEADDKGVLVLMDGLEPGEHTVCLDAVNTDGPGWSSLGCVQVVVK